MDLAPPLPDLQPAALPASPPVAGDAPDAGPPAGPAEGVPPRRGKPVAIIVAVIATAAALGMAGLWLTARSDLAAASARIAAFEADAAATKAAEVALPDLDAKVSAHGLARYVEGSATETSVSLSFSKYASGWESNLRSLLDDLGFNASGTMARIGNTRALDGTLTAKGTHVEASWTYHPDDGLSIVFERD